MTNKMMSSLKFGRQGKVNGPHLRPPALQNFDLLLSQGVDDNFDAKIDGLSDVEEKSFFESEAEEPDHQDMQIFLGKMERLSKEQEQQASPSQIINRSQRLQDQPIIFVEQENQKSDHFGEQSVILEHLDFNKQEQAPDMTPDWQHETDKKQELYMIRVNNQPGWLYSQNGSSTPREFESQDKLSPVRYSQNTCVDKKRVFQDTSRVVNKSCIARPMGGEGLLYVNNKETKIQGKKSRDINDILDKWNDQGEHDGYLDLPFNMERDAKICRSSYQEESPDVQVQTELQGTHIEQERSKFQQQIENLKNTVKNIELENANLREKLNEKKQETDKLKNSLNLLRTSSQANKKWYEQSCRLENCNKELEKKLSTQVLVLKDYESKNQALQKKLNQTMSNRPTTDSYPSNYFPSLELKKLHTFGEDAHEKCIKQIEELQQYIFNIEQKVAGIDIEVQRRVRIIAEHIEHEAQRRASLEFNNTMIKLKDQLKRAQTQLEMAELQIQNYENRQNTMKDKQAQIGRMQEEIVQQWRQLEFQKEKQISPRRELTSASQLPTNNGYSPRVLTDRTQKNNYFSNRDIGYLTNRRQKTNLPMYETNISYEKQASFLKQNKPAWKREQSLSVSTFADSGELLALNSKIQKLRKEINRELQSIH